MNSGRGKINRYYRHGHRRGPTIPNRQFCLKCFKYGHQRRICSNEPLVACGNCFRAYFFTTECVCDMTRAMTAHEMTLRLVSDQRYPRPCMDVTIGQKVFPAYFNLATSQTTVNINVFNHINATREQQNLPIFDHQNLIPFPVKRRNRLFILELQVNPNQPELVILGNDFLTKSGFDFKVDCVNINELSPLLENTLSIEFLYNMPQGESLRSWLENNDRPLFNGYQKEQQPSLQDEPVVLITNEEVAADQAEDGEVANEDVLDLHPENEDLNDI